MAARSTIRPVLGGHSPKHVAAIHIGSKAMLRMRPMFVTIVISAERKALQNWGMLVGSTSARMMA